MGQRSRFRESTHPESLGWYGRGGDHEACRHLGRRQQEALPLRLILASPLAIHRICVVYVACVWMSSAAYKVWISTDSQNHGNCEAIRRAATRYDA